MPQQPEDDPKNFWPIRRDVVRRYHPEPIDAILASEPYGRRLALETGARFVPVDEAWTAFPVSAKAIRNLACEHELVSRGVNFARINGSPELRRTKAMEAVEQVLKTHR